MNVNAVLGFISKITTNGQPSSVFTRFVARTGLYGFIDSVINFIMGLLYTVAKYFLYFVDLIYSYIQKLCGLDMSLESLDAMISEDSDIVFNLLISGRDVVTIIIQNLIVIAIALIIIFAIIAIIKGQYDAVKKGQETSPMEAIKTTFKAFILLLVTPLMAIGGIIFSDLLLQTFYNATNVTGAMSLGTQIFMTASSSANAFRIYAQNDQRMPITFDGSKNAQISEYFSTHEVSEGFVKYLQESKSAGNSYNPIYATYMSFMSSDFTKFSDMNTIIAPTNESIKETKGLYDQFYDYYVVESEEDPNNTLKELRRIDCYAEYYYVMADVVDFCISSASPVYFKTIEQVLDSIYKLPDDVDKDSIFKLMVEQYGIEFYANYDAENDMLTDKVEGIQTAKDYYTQKGTFKIIAFNSNYLASSDGGEPEKNMQVSVKHVVGAEDELLGAKFIVAAERTVSGQNGVYSSYMEPIVNGSRVVGTSIFKSDYIKNGSIVVAKGIFQDAKYPTAIRIKRGQDQSGKTVESLEFYRENIESQAEGQMDKYVSFHAESSGGLFSRLIKMVSALFNPAELVPKLEVDFDAMVLDYTKGDTTPIDTLVDARMRIGYFMSYSTSLPSPSIIKNMGLSFKALYVASKLNFLLLIVGSILLLRVSFNAISSLIERAYELFLIFLTYPAACVTIPIDGGNAYNTWLKGYMARLFRTYGFILGINFVLLLFPVIESIEFFTQDEIGSTKIVRRVGALFFGIMTVRQITYFMNLIVAVMFELVAFTLIETIPDVISTIVAGKESALKLKEQNVFTKIKDLSVKVAFMIAKMIRPEVKGFEYIVSLPKEKAKMRSKFKEEMQNKISKAGLGNLTQKERFVPGSAINKELAFKQHQKQAEQQQQQSLADLQQTLDDPNTSKDDVMQAMARYQSAAVERTNSTGPMKCTNGHRFGSNAEYRAAVRKVKENDNRNLFKGEGYCPTCYEESGANITMKQSAGSDKNGGGGGASGGGDAGGGGGK